MQALRCVEWMRERLSATEANEQETRANDIYECKQEVNISVLWLFLWYFYEGFYVLNGYSGSRAPFSFSLRSDKYYILAFRKG